MGIKKLVMTSLLAIAATGITVGTAHAAPAKLAPTEFRGADHGVVYSAGLSKDHKGATTTLKSGKFVMAPDRNSVAVTAPNGAVTARLPLSFDAAGRHFTLAPELDKAGKSLTLRPTASAPVDVAAYNKEIAKVQPQLKDVMIVGAIGGVVIGASIGLCIGLVIGLIIGLPFLVIGAIPGAIIGAIAGAIVGGIAGGIFLGVVF